MKFNYILLSLLFLIDSSFAENLIDLQISNSSFSPWKKERVTIRLFSPYEGLAHVSINTPDGLSIKSFNDIKLQALKPVEFDWDGKDNNGRIVPNEAYFPKVIYETTNGSKFVYDPIISSGGETVENLPVSFNDDFSIGFRLTKPSRILIRAGVRNGPMLKSIVSWKPFPKGSVVIPWNGKAAGKLVNIVRQKGFHIFATAYRLPDDSILVTGGTESYISYCKNLVGNPSFSKNKAEYYYSRNNLSLNYLKSKCQPSEPEIQLTSLDIIDKKLSVTINLPELYMRAIDQDLYEIGIYIDNKFVAEHEQGYLPFYWKKDISSLSKGVHTITVNITGYAGQVGTITDLFTIK